RIVHRQGGLGDHRQHVRVVHPHATDVLHVFYQVDAAVVELAHGAFHFRVALVSDHDELVALAAQLGHFHMHLGHQGAGRIEDLKAPVIGLMTHGLAHAVGAEDEGGAGGHLGEVFDEDGTLGHEIVHHVGVVHDLVTHIDGRAVLGQGPLHDLDGAVDAGAKAPRLGQQNIVDTGGHGSVGPLHSTPIRCT